MRNMSSLASLLIWLSVLIGFMAGCSEESEPMALGQRAKPADRNGERLYGIKVDVSYAGSRKLLTDAAMVYVFLRPPGERMPLAVQQFSSHELPRSVSFAGSRNEAVELVVRLSPSGRVDRSPEDIEVVKRLSALRHPSETLPVVLGTFGTAAKPVAIDTAPKTADEARISTSISLADGHAFSEKVTVFVIAREPGQVIPSVVKRLTVGELPADFELTDADAMTFSNRLSNSSVLELFARVSISGSASRSDSDWLSDTVSLDMNRLPDTVALMIGPP